MEFGNSYIEKEIMQCKKCNTKIPDDSKFCKECGAKIILPQPMDEQLEISLSGLKTIRENSNNIPGELSIGDSKNLDNSVKVDRKCKILFKAVRGNLIGRKYSAEEPLIIHIGRDDNCELCISREMDSGISRQHCMLEINPPNVLVSDLGSKNGTYINEKPINPNIKSDLKNGDSLRIGETEFVIEIVEFKKPSVNNVVTKFLAKQGKIV